MFVKRYLVFSWVLFITGLILASQFDDNWPMIIIGIFGAAASFIRSLIPKEESFRLGEFLNQHQTLKWLTVFYLLIVAGFALKYMDELSELLTNTNVALLLLMFFPVFIIWAMRDYTLYVNSDKRP